MKTVLLEKARRTFEYCRTCGSLADALARMREERYSKPGYSQAAGFGMVAAAIEGLCETRYYEDTLTVLDRLGEAKALLDKEACHGNAVRTITARTLAAAQAYVEEHTIPCNEWPMPQTVVEYALAIAAEAVREVSERGDWEGFGLASDAERPI